MIYDEFGRCSCYESDPRLKAGFDLLRRLAETPECVPRTQAGDGIYYMINENPTKPADQCRYESHRDYLDIQYVVSGSELMGFRHVAELGEPQEAFPERDIYFYPNVREDSRLPMKAGFFAVFFPQDGHAPLVSDGVSDKVRKIIVKIPVEWK